MKSTSFSVYTCGSQEAIDSIRWQCTFGFTIRYFVSSLFPSATKLATNSFSKPSVTINCSSPSLPSISFWMRQNTLRLLVSHLMCIFKFCYISIKLGSKACKTPLKFLTVKLLWHMQILWKHGNSRGKNTVNLT